MVDSDWLVIASSDEVLKVCEGKLDKDERLANQVEENLAPPPGFIYQHWSSIHSLYKTIIIAHLFCLRYFNFKYLSYTKTKIFYC